MVHVQQLGILKFSNLLKQTIKNAQKQNHFTITTVLVLRLIKNLN